MDKEYLTDAVDRGLSQRAIAKECDCSQTRVKYWLKKHGLKTRPVRTRMSPKIPCPMCGKRETRGGACGSCYVKVQRFRRKRIAVRLLGGKCNRCGWEGDLAAFDFHHRDKTKKDFIISQRIRKWSLVEKELKKCELLCSNCHRAEHSMYSSPALIEIADRYSGSLLQ